MNGRGAVTVFRVRGIPIRVHLSWLAIVGLITWSLSIGYFPQLVPGLSPATHWLQGFAAALLLFVSVLLHELSHALTARRYGIPVSGITLHVFGGVSQLTREPERPGIELAVAIVGPLTSLGLAVVLAVVEAVTSLPAVIDAVVHYLVLVNTIVGVFNLAPGFPLDGGRLLRAALWKAKGDLVWATQTASRVGGAFAMVLIVVGAFRAIAGQFLGGLWLVLIGFFLRQGAEGSYQQVRLERILRPLTVRDGMTRAPIAIPADLPAAQAVDEFFWRHHVSSFPVLDGERVVGILALDRVKEVPRARWGEVTVRDLMAPRTEALTAAPGDSLWQAFGKLSQNGLGRLAVLEDGRLVGYLSIRDVAHLLAVAT